MNMHPTHFRSVNAGLIGSYECIGSPLIPIAVQVPIEEVLRSISGCLIIRDDASSAAALKCNSETAVGLCAVVVGFVVVNKIFNASIILIVADASVGSSF